MYIYGSCHKINTWVLLFWNTLYMGRIDAYDACAGERNWSRHSTDGEKTKVGAYVVLVPAFCVLHACSMQLVSHTVECY